METDETKMSTSKIGLSMLYLLREPFSEMVRRLPTTATSYVEVVDEGLHALNKQRVSILRDLRDSYGLKYSVHAPFIDINIASSSASIARAMTRILSVSMKYAASLDAYVWVFHPGLKNLYYQGMDWNQNTRTANSMARTARDLGVKIAIENVPSARSLMKNVDDFKKFYEEVSADVGIALDIGHANINAQTETFLETFPNRVIHIHASDNAGSDDQHLGIGSGTVNWKRIAGLLRKLDYGGTIVVESEEDVEGSLEKLKRLID